MALIEISKIPMRELMQIPQLAVIRRGVGTLPPESDLGFYCVELQLIISRLLPYVVLPAETVDDLVNQGAAVTRHDINAHGELISTPVNPEKK